MMQTDMHALLKEWCESLLKTQITSTDPALNGGLWCSCCGLIHGRCFEAILPFMYLAKSEKDSRWITASERLFDWAMHNVSQDDGSFLNDIDATWKGTTVFNTIALVSALRYYAPLLDDATIVKWRDRARKAAEYLYGADSLKANNINYPLTNALSLALCSFYFSEARYREKAKELASLFYGSITPSGLLYGEGVPHSRRTAKGCYPVDIGYNLEETLPSLLLYAKEVDDTRLFDAVSEVFTSHLPFITSDGGIDNSFGTRNYKWTYWGSRTNDGLALGALLLAKKSPVFATVANKNLALLSSCTKNGLLFGGPDYQIAGEKACIHHTFAHAKVLAEILERNLIEDGHADLPMPRHEREAFLAYPELQTWIYASKGMSATITAYDWEIQSGMHTSGGNISFLEHPLTGPILASSLAVYTRREPRNMQESHYPRHESLSPRIEATIDGIHFSNIFDESALITRDGSVFKTEGLLCTQDHIGNKDCPYRLLITCKEDTIWVNASCATGYLVLPLIAKETEASELRENTLIIHKEKADIILSTQSAITYPHGEKRIFNLVPGFEAIKVCIPLKAEGVIVQISVVPRR